MTGHWLKPEILQTNPIALMFHNPENTMMRINGINVL